MLFFLFQVSTAGCCTKKDASTKKTLRREFVLVAGCHFFMRRRQIKQKALETGIQSKLSKPQKRLSSSRGSELFPQAGNTVSFQRFQCEVESKQLDTRLAQYLRHKSTVSLPPNLTERSLVHFIPALRLLKPHVKKKLYQPKLVSP